MDHDWQLASHSLARAAPRQDNASTSRSTGRSSGHAAVRSGAPTAARWSTRRLVGSAALVSIAFWAILALVLWQVLQS